MPPCGRVVGIAQDPPLPAFESISFFREQFVFYNSRIVAEKMKTIDFILDRKFHLHTPKKEGFRTASKVALKKKGALFGHSSWKTLIRDGDPHKEE